MGEQNNYKTLIGVHRMKVIHPNYCLVPCSSHEHISVQWTLIYLAGCDFVMSTHTHTHTRARVLYLTIFTSSLVSKS